MKTLESVLGVSGVCWVGFRNSTQVGRPETVACRQVCWVCWVYARAGVCAQNIFSNSRQLNFSHARPEKADKPNTLNTTSFNSLNLKDFLCVGFVLGCLFSVLGLFCWGIWG